MLPASEAKIERAKEQIYDLDSGLQSFVQSGGYGTFGEEDPQTGDWVIRVRVGKPIPLRFGVIVGEVIHDLRSSLDHLICHFIVTKGGTPNRNSGFPISNSLKEFEANGLRKIERTGTDVIRVVKELQPYRGGHDGLWQLHRCSVSEKHHLAALVGTAYATGTIKFAPDRMESKIPDVPLGLHVSRPLFPLEDGAELCRFINFAQNAHDNGQHQSFFQIAFRQGEVFEGEPLIPTLLQLAGLTEDTLKLFDCLL